MIHDDSTITLPFYVPLVGMTIKHIGMIGFLHEIPNREFTKSYHSRTYSTKQFVTNILDA